MQSKIEQQVMASVAVVYAFRQLTGATALKLYVCALSLYGIGRLVRASRVWENLAHVGVQTSLQFIFSAVLNPHLPVQIALAILIVAGLGLVRDLTRSIGSSSFQAA